jgi:phosphatidylglycerol:prolipoprotein diacylglycerol transferase
MALLLWLSRRYAGRLKRGDLFLIYLIGYPTARFFLEFLRLDTSPVSGVNANQTVMAVVALLAAAWLYWRHRPGAPAEDPEPTPRAPRRLDPALRRSPSGASKETAAQIAVREDTAAISEPVEPPAPDEPEQPNADDNAANPA